MLGVSQIYITVTEVEVAGILEVVKSIITSGGQSVERNEAMGLRGDNCMLLAHRP